MCAWFEQVKVFTRISAYSSNSAPSILHFSAFIVNARRMREGYCSHPVCLCICVSVCLCVCVSVCLCVCYRPSADIRRVCDKIGLPVYSSLHAKGFKLSVFAKKPSISSSSLFSLSTAERAAILKHWSCYVDFNDHYQQLSNIPTVHCVYAASWRFELE